MQILSVRVTSVVAALVVASAGAADSELKGLYTNAEGNASVEDHWTRF